VLCAAVAACGGGGGGGTNPPSNKLTLTGVVRDASAAPITGAAVLMGQSPATTDASGGFSYPNLLPGQYVISVQANSGWFDCREVTLSASNTNFDFTLPATPADFSVASVEPQLNSTNNSLNASLSLEFAENVDPASVSAGDFSITPASGTLQVQVVQQTIKLIPSLQFALDQVVLVELVGQISSSSGAALAQPIRWRFRTAAADTFPPVLMSTEPVDGATGFAPNLALVFTFGEALAAADSQLVVSATPDADLTATVSGRTVLVDAAGGWQINTAYTVTLAGVMDKHANREHIEYSLSFTTGSEPAPFRDLQPDWNRILDTLVFASNRAGGYDIYSIRSDGTNLVRLTSQAGDELHPSLSSDGVLLCYQKRGADGDWDIFVQALDGGEPSAVTSSGANDTEPAFSRTSSRDIFFTSDRSGGTSIFKMHSDGSSLRELDSSFGWGQSEPAPHPLVDGQLLFTANRTGDSAIWRKSTSAVDDSVVNQNLTESLASNEHAPCWNADASAIGFISDFGGVDNLWLADATGGFAHQVTYFDYPADDPVLEPLAGSNSCALSVGTADGGADLVLVDLVSGDVLLNLSQGAGH
jgi:hypothetical protein